MREINSYHRPGCGQERVPTSSGHGVGPEDIRPSPRPPGASPLLSFPSRTSWALAVSPLSSIFPDLPLSSAQSSFSRNRQTSLIWMSSLLVHSEGQGQEQLAPRPLHSPVWLSIEPSPFVHLFARLTSGRPRRDALVLPF